MKKLIISLITIFITISPVISYAQISKNYTIEENRNYGKLERDFYIPPLVKPKQDYTVREIYTQIHSLNLNEFQEPLFVAKLELNAIDKKKLQLVLGIITMLGMCVVRAFATTLPKDYLPWVTVAITVLLYAIIGAFGGWPNDKIFIDALILSTSAGGLWSLVGKHVLNLDY